MGITVSQINSAVSKAQRQSVSVTGIGYDLAETIEIRSYRFKGMFWDLRDSRKTTLELLNVAENEWQAPEYIEGYYVDGKMRDGAEVMFGKIYKIANENVLCGEAGDNVMVGHIRKIKGQWKFRSGHDCRSYRPHRSIGTQEYAKGEGPCGYYYPTIVNEFGLLDNLSCGDYGDIWKD